MDYFLLFTIDQRRYALPLTVVRRVERMVEAVPLPDAPPLIAGVIDFHGEMVPLFDLRRRFDLPPRPPLPTDHLLLTTTQGRTVALAIDEAQEVRLLPAFGPEILPSPVLRPTADGDGAPLFLLDLNRLVAETGVTMVAEVDDGGSF